jgi:hypothetical protein
LTEPREVTIVIGKRRYSISTLLDKPTFERVAAIVKGVSASLLKDGLDQDHLLMLTCLRLAYSLENTMGKLSPLVDVLENLEPWEPGPEPHDMAMPLVMPSLSATGDERAGGVPDEK